ncbi:4-oxalocrotonate tautomerase [Nocardia yunnanensis]|uniref:4-oxalocrotonate tautomerase n=1 Tax=Nocardia yunnanensis TaxID=2382165 RepID=A0A386ZCH3_9NOCA|nr:tautomerase family protein [Nocardia yunnanensis]AYF74199.1 4-oxalocrotonate tautomerase [Nocardia yunnanensis]
MPLWHIYHPVDTYTEQDKQDFAADITEIYTRVGLPAFYVVVQFHEMPPTSVFVSGKPSGDTVRVVVKHLARHLDTAEGRKRMTERLADVIRPYAGDRGLHSEFHIEDTPRDQWMIAGLWPPASGSDAEKAWAAANRPMPY